MYTAKIIIIAFCLIMICVGLAVWANTSVMNLSQKAKIQKINSFSDCASAGYPIQESYPRRCAIPQGKSFTEELNSPEPGFIDNSSFSQSDTFSNQSPDSAPNLTPVYKSDPESICVNKCGDSICQMVVCQGTGCPCPETANSCPQDCR